MAVCAHRAAAGIALQPLGPQRGRWLVHRRGSSLIRETVNSNIMNTICGCLLRAHKVIHNERSQVRPALRSHACFRHTAVIANAALSAAPSALRTERL